MKSDETVVTGVSGGADSLYLLFHLQQAGQPVIAAILDHQLRPESSREVAFVQEICVTYGVPCVAGKADVAALAQTRRCSIEEAARIARYEFLFGVARRHHAAAVATAHHADDQVETVLMHFLRGSGLEGLTGMRPRTILPQWDPEEKIPLIRPILANRDQILVQRNQTDACRRSIQPGHAIFPQPAAAQADSAPGSGIQPANQAPYPDPGSNSSRRYANHS